MELRTSTQIPPQSAGGEIGVVRKYWLNPQFSELHHSIFSISPDIPAEHPRLLPGLP
jgi:hypothetical protein